MQYHQRAHTLLTRRSRISMILRRCSFCQACQGAYFGARAKSIPARQGSDVFAATRPSPAHRARRQPIVLMASPARCADRAMVLTRPKRAANSVPETVTQSLASASPALLASLLMRTVYVAVNVVSIVQLCQQQVKPEAFAAAPKVITTSPARSTCASVTAIPPVTNNK